MSIVEWVATVQTNSPAAPTSNPPGAEYFVVAIIAVVLALAVWVFIRTSPRRSSKQ